MPISPRGKSFMLTHGSGADRVRLTFKTHEEALAKEAELISKEKAVALAALQNAQKGDPAKTLQDAYNRAYREVWVGSKGERTTVLNAKQMVALIGANTPLVEIVTDTITDALDELADGDDESDGNSNATLNKKLAALNVMLKGAQERGWIKDVPRVKRRKEAEGRTYWYTEEDETEMLKVAHLLGLPRLADWITFGINTGMRRSEMLRLKVEDCDEMFVRLHNGETKNGAGRMIPASTSTRAIVQKARDAGYGKVFEDVTNNGLRGMWGHMRAHLKKEEDPKYIVHVLRHTCATRLAFKGVTAPQIQAWMGHKAIQTSMRYIHLTGNHLVGLADILERDTKPALRLVSNA